MDIDGKYTLKEYWNKLQEVNDSDAYSYPDAGEDAQPGVKADIERWRELPIEERENQPLLYWLLGEGTPDYKMSKDDSEYVDESQVEGQTCKNCEFAYHSLSNDTYICSQISGPIMLDGWCKLWVKGVN